MKQLYGIIIGESPYKINFMPSYDIVKKLNGLYDLINRKRLIDKYVDCAHAITNSEFDIFSDLRFSSKDEIIGMIELEKYPSASSGFSKDDAFILDKLIILQKLIYKDYEKVSGWIENKMQFNKTLNSDMLREANKLYKKYAKTG